MLACCCARVRMGQCSEVLPICNRAVPLQEAHAEADPAAPEPATAEVAPADAEVPPVADKEGLATEVTPAAVDSTAAAGEPIAEAVVALQEVMEPAPVPEPVLEGLLFGSHAFTALGCSWQWRWPCIALHGLVSNTMALSPRSSQNSRLLGSIAGCSG